VLYLSPELERSAVHIVVGTVAHELAHIILWHDCTPIDNHEGREQSAWDLVTDWGFGAQVRKVRAVRKWRQSRERPLSLISLESGL
jgi:predicted SprT family Zn-dependent metalloprotease